MYKHDLIIMIICNWYGNEKGERVYLSSICTKAYTDPNSVVSKLYDLK